MGNLLTGFVAFAAPFITKEYIIVNIFHPYRHGGIPFKPPGIIKYTIVYVIALSFLIGAMATVSGLMTSSRQCRKISIQRSLHNSIWAVSFALIGLVLFK